jgi:hypothetical protein
VQDSQGIVKIAAEFYKNLFAWEDRKPFYLGTNFWDPTDLVQAGENVDVEAPFSEEEVKKSVFNSYAEEALGLMVYFSFFTQNFGR